MAEKIRAYVVANDYRAYSLVRPSYRDSSAAYSARDQALALQLPPEPLVIRRTTARSHPGPPVVLNAL